MNLARQKQIARSFFRKKGVDTEKKCAKVLRMTKTYSLEDVQYHFNRNSRKWNFVAGTNTFLFDVPGGKMQADAVARQINGGYKRTKKKGIDAIARKNIDKVLSLANTEE
jgi:hypothetical protein